MNYEKLKKDLRSLNIPKEYMRINFDELESHDFYIMMSIRKDAGKTSQWITTALASYIQGYTTAYMRSDEAQLTKANLETLFDVIKRLGYVEKLFKEYNDIHYKSMVKKFYLCKTDEEGNIVKEDPTPFMSCYSLESWQKYKSGRNQDNCWLIIYDEFMDTSRRTNTQMVELQNNISTLFRGRGVEAGGGHIAMLGNNTNKYNFWFEELTIEKEIGNLTYGGCIDKTTPYGTTIFASMLDVSDKLQDNVLKRKIRFSGFDTPKMNAFNGFDVWAGNSHPHIPYEDWLDPAYLINNRIYIKHRNRYVQLNTYYNEYVGYYCYIHYANKPLLDDNIILTAYPEDKQELYGFGQFAPANLYKKLYNIISLRDQRKWYYATNSVGELVQDYLQEIK